MNVECHCAIHSGPGRCARHLNEIEQFLLWRTRPVEIEQINGVYAGRYAHFGILRCL